jgi:mono/diheme cytochrome c family protein
MSVGDELEARSRRGTTKGAEALWTSAPVQAALNRKKVPLWVMPILVFIPVWAIIYLGGLSPAETGEPSQIELGREVYVAQCSICHGSAGEGGVGRPLSNGDLAATFPDLIGQLEFVHRGSERTGAPNTPYGDPDREGGPHLIQGYGGARMPPFGASLTGAELLAVVRYEREVLSGVEIAPEQLDDAGNMTWPDGAPMLDTAGDLITPQGEPLLDQDGELTIQPNWTAPVAGKG